MAEQLIPYVSGVQYNGSNGAAILAEIPAPQVTDYDIYIISESGGTLVLGFESGGPNSHTYETGDWVTWGAGGPPGSYTDHALNAERIKRSDLP